MKLVKTKEAVKLSLSSTLVLMQLSLEKGDNADRLGIYTGHPIKDGWACYHQFGNDIFCAPIEELDATTLKEWSDRTAARDLELQEFFKK